MREGMTFYLGSYTEESCWADRPAESVGELSESEARSEVFRYIRCGRFQISLEQIFNQFAAQSDMETLNTKLIQ